jgi:hypothetical protein
MKMIKLKKHSTARPVKCKECGQEFSALWGETIIHALGGKGLCDECKEEAERASRVKVAKPKPKDKPGKDDDGAKARPVQTKGD